MGLRSKQSAPFLMKFPKTTSLSSELCPTMHRSKNICSLTNFLILNFAKNTYFVARSPSILSMFWSMMIIRRFISPFCLFLKTNSATALSPSSTCSTLNCTELIWIRVIMFFIASWLVQLSSTVRMLKEGRQAGGKGCLLERMYCLLPPIRLNNDF
jgi:hypothetical protein